MHTQAHTHTLTSRHTTHNQTCIRRTVGVAWVRPVTLSLNGSGDMQQLWCIREKMPQLACTKCSLHKQGGWETGRMPGRDRRNEKEVDKLLSLFLKRSGNVLMCSLTDFWDMQIWGGRRSLRLGKRERGNDRGRCEEVTYSSPADERERLSGNKQNWAARFVKKIGRSREELTLA